MRPSSSRARSLLLVALAGMLGCAELAFGPEGNTVAGTYSSTRFVTTSTTGQTTDQHAAGSFLGLVLSTTGATDGLLHIAASGADPAFDASMAGTWTQSGNQITFTQTADTFVRDTPFTAQLGPNNRWQLVTDRVFSGIRVEMTLTQ